MKRRIHSDNTFLIVVLFVIIVAASILFSVIYKAGENIFVTQYLENLGESAHKLGDSLAGALDEKITAAENFYLRNSHAPIGLEPVEQTGRLGSTLHPLVFFEISDSAGSIRYRWFDPELGDTVRDVFITQLSLERHLPDVYTEEGKVFVGFRRKLDTGPGEVWISGFAAVDGAPFLSSLKVIPDAIIIVNKDRFYPLLGVAERGGCLTCHLEKDHERAFPVPHRGFIEERGLSLSGSVDGFRFVLDPLDLDGTKDSYLLLRFESEEMLPFLTSFKRLIFPTWLVLCVVIMLGTVILFRRLREPAKIIAPQAEKPTGEMPPPGIEGEEQDRSGFRKGDADVTVPPLRRRMTVGDVKRDAGGEINDYQKFRENTLAKIKELSEFLSSVNRITYPERLGDTIVWNIMNLLPGELILLAVMETAGLEGEYDVFSAQRFRRDSVAEMFIKKMHREFPSYVKNVIHMKIADMESDPFFARYGIYNHGLKKGLLLPIEIKGVILGVLGIFRKGNDPFSPFDVELASVLARHLGTVIENSKLHEEVKTNYFNTLRGLVNSIEEKDRYRRGHSERVTEIALSMGDRAGLSKRRRSILFQAAVLHDIGKITINPAILGKRGKLTEDETRLIRQHPVIGYRIIEPLSFLREVKACISEHHERYDGKGYPSGIKKDELTLEGRILAVADAFDSMTSDRPYRKPMTDREAIEELQKNSGGQFDPAVVDLFLAVYRDREHQRFSTQRKKKIS